MPGNECKARTNEQDKADRAGHARDGAGQWQPQIGRDSGRRVEDSADRERPARGWRGLVQGGGGEGAGRGALSQGADGRWKTGDWNVLACWRAAALGLCFVAALAGAEVNRSQWSGRQKRVEMMLQHARQRHKQAAKQTARQLRWDPGKQTQALSHTHSSHKGCRTGQGPTGLVLGCWVQGAGCLEMGLEERGGGMLHAGSRVQATQ